MTSAHDTIAALATPPSTGALGIIRVSGTQAIPIVNVIFRGKDLSKAKSHCVYLGVIQDQNNVVIDEVLVCVFRSPRSYTKEDVIEISAHGSPYILQQILNLLITKGARAAIPGEFTQRAFLNGRFDLAQAEAVADLIASENASMQQSAINQMRDGYAKELKKLRSELIHFASMLELELDFSEEDVAFADRSALAQLIRKTQGLLHSLIEGFSYGNAIKNGVSVVIAGKPNAGKSTLLNALLREERAIVSPIAGTTRDAIEEVITIDGIHFRFTDTAGIRTTTDSIERIGVKRTLDKMKQAHLVIYLIDLMNDSLSSIASQLNKLKKSKQSYLIVGNKSDAAEATLVARLKKENSVLISAKNKQNLDGLKKKIFDSIGTAPPSYSIVTNSRHLHSFELADQALSRASNGIDTKLSSDILAQDIREALVQIGEVTGEVTTDDLLDNIFSKFCIGK